MLKSGHPGEGITLFFKSGKTVARQVNDDRPLTEYELTAIYWLVPSVLFGLLTGVAMIMALVWDLLLLPALLNRFVRSR